MLTKISMLGAGGWIRDFVVGGVNPDDTIILKSISGLTPSDVTLFTGDFAGNGGYYQGRRFGGRNVVFTFKLNPDYTADGFRSVSSLREELYGLFYQPFYSSEKLTVFLYDDDYPNQPRAVDIYADKYQGDIFSQDTSAQISTQCVDAFIRGQLIQYAAPGGGVLTVPITYRGTAPTGIQFSLTAVVDGTTWSVDIFGQKMTWNGAFVAGDVFAVSTIDGNRYITKQHAAVVSNALGGLSASSNWLTLNKGTSNLRAYGSAVGDGKMALNSYSYTEQWMGV